MRVFFDKKDFMLCDVPVPKGYKQSQTHSGIALYDGVYYLTTSPYPSYREPVGRLLVKTILKKLGVMKIPPFVAEQWENPCLYIGNVGENNYVTSYKLMQTSPLMHQPDPYYGLPSFNSDPDLFVENGTIHVLNRQTFRTEMCPGELLNKYRNRLYHIYGNIDGDRFYYRGTELLIDTDKMLVSPCLFFYDHEYLLTELETNTYNDGLSFEGLYYARSSTIKGFKNPIEWKKIKVECDKYLPWHMSLFSYKGILYTIIACVERGKSQRLWQLLGEFDKDLTRLFLYETPLTDYKSYRSSAVIDDNGEFILYNTTVHETVKGSNSVDGRDIVMAHAPFERVLDFLKEAGTHNNY